MNMRSVNFPARFMVPAAVAAVLAALLLLPEADAKSTSPVLQGKSFVWALESERNTIYFMGSIHVLRKESYPLPAAVEEIYRCCRKLVFETDIRTMSTPETAKRIEHMGRYSRGESLSRNIDRDTRGLLNEKLSRSGLSLELFESYRPWYIAQAVASAELIRLGFDPSLGIDKYFFNKALQDGKELEFLETNIYQVNLFAALGREKQEVLLRQILRDLEVIEKNFSAMERSWRDGDARSLGAFLAESFQGYPQLYKRFISDRNRKWISKIRALMKEDEDVLVVVGAAHLAGEDSLIDLLQRKGYRLVQR